MASTVYHFQDFELDIGMFELRRHGHVVAVGPRGFDVLCYLVRHRDRVVPKEELLRSVWSVSVGASVLPRCMTVLRRALGDDGAIIETVRGRGYRFRAPVESDTGTSLERRSTIPPPLDSDGATFRHAPLFGRADVLDRCRAAIDQSKRGAGSVLLLAGEPGIGKTALLRELRRLATERGALAVGGRGYERAEAVPFWPWIEALRGLTQRLPPDDLEASLTPHFYPLLEVLPELEEVLPDPRPAPSVAPDRARFRLFDAVRQFLTRAAMRVPLLVTLDDFHCADAASLRLLEFVARGVGRMPVCIAITYRDVERSADPALTQTVGALAREPDCERIELRGLSAAEVSQFIGFAGPPHPHQKLAERVHALTGGNPLFVSELARLARDAGQWSVLDGTRVPRRVLDAVVDQLRSLSDVTNTVLEAGAVIGRDLHPGVLAHTAGVSRQAALGALDEAVAARILRRSEKGHSFRHAIVRDAVYEKLTDARRAALHLAYANALEEIGATSDAQIAALAHHYLEAVPTGVAKQALAYLQKAALVALDAHAPEQAAELLGHAIVLVEREPLLTAASRVDLRLDLGRAQARARRRAHARDSFECAAREARALGDAHRLARAAVGFAGESELFLPRDEARLQLLEEARARLGPAGALELRSILTSELSATAPHWEDLGTRRALAAEALELARQSQSRRAVSRALMAQCFALLGPDHAEECLAYANEMLDASVRDGSPLDEIQALDILMVFQIARGEVGEARRTLDHVERVVRENGFTFWEWWVRSSRTSMAIVEARFADARGYIAQNMDLGQSVEHPLVLPVAAGQWMQLAVLTGNHDMLGGSLDVFERFSWGPRLLTVTEATIANTLGRHDRERALVATFPSDLTTIPRDEFWLIMLAMMGFSIASVGDRARAAAAYELLLPYRSWNAVHLLTRLHVGSVAGTLARLAYCLGVRDEAYALFEEALAADRRNGAWAPHWLTQWEYAATLMQSDRPGEVDRGRVLGQEAVTFAERLGMHSLVERGRRALEARVTAPI